MDDYAVTLMGVSKSYKLYSKPSHRLREALRLNSKPLHKPFYALRDINLNIARGETLALIGENGSGKSTLLKLVAGVLTPSSGYIRVNGSVAALLELGAGFNPEYTGVENIYLNGTLRGLSRREVDAYIDDVLAFADIGDFATQQVKTYSSGMFVRLAFALATCVYPDILIVDEALSVGDLFFQAKCIRRIKQLIDSGVTLLFVSHDMSAVKSVCKKAALLEDGRITRVGPAGEVAYRYFQKTSGSPPKSATDMESAPEIVFDSEHSASRTGDGRAMFAGAGLFDEAGAPLASASFGQRAVLKMAIKTNCDIDRLCVGYHILDYTGVDVVYSDTAIENCDLSGLKAGQTYTLEWRFDLMLAEGAYNIACVCSIPLDMSIGSVEFCDYVPLAVQFSMQRREGAKLYAKAYWKNEVETGVEQR